MYARGGYSRVSQPNTRRVRVDNGGTDLGALPVLIAAVPSVKTLAMKAFTSVISIFDPGKKREANRKNRAQFWGETARAGSITAARVVLGGRTMVYTINEKGYYEDQWKQLVAADSKLAAQAQALGGLPVPEPGSDVEPMRLSDEQLAALQAEIEAYRNPPTSGGGGGAKPSAPGSPQQAGITLILGLGILGAFLARGR